ncbi:MAG: GGDEF domain-containing protein [Candidatus Melainabacteria bacterium]|nr:MAG: GGDEF domain-containing protein [Candidatus Melainabacteria bacterium]
MMTDIDFFKKINDTYGHIAGDIVLKKVASIIESQLREYDTASRYGGEEFCILLPYTTIEEAKFVAERLRKKVESEKIDISQVYNEQKRSKCYNKCWCKRIQRTHNFKPKRFVQKKLMKHYIKQKNKVEIRLFCI